MIIHVGPLSELPSDARVIVLVGSRSSDHLRELARIAEWKGRIAYRIESAAELQPRWFSGVEVVGIVVGAANLQGIVQAVLERLRYFERVAGQGMLEGIAR